MAGPPPRSLAVQASVSLPGGGPERTADSIMPQPGRHSQTKTGRQTTPKLRSEGAAGLARQKKPATLAAGLIVHPDH